MLKTKDFYLMKVYDIKGKYLGVIEDLCIDFYNAAVKGFFISNFMLLSNKNFASIDDIISLDEVLIVKKIVHFKGLTFRNIKDMDIIDTNNIMKGALEDLLIEKKDLSIKGLIMSSGLFDKMIKGKEILLVNECILGEDFILYHGSESMKFKAIPHKKINENIQKV
ncbi:PRC-barrel domain-containing protein [Clostridium chauvoei]|uniref:PRC-barrel domain-containing protein n=1 Tax=Clostridium chauvoei TaxID=46867 RepID=UPI001C86151B|nr:PRC-barrel domain-containing protein [Clostridium chauvoei]MBX7368490.1 PRC-barrel domain-containing protein [Clostridium chauvoei]